MKLVHLLAVMAAMPYLVLSQSKYALLHLSTIDCTSLLMRMLQQVIAIVNRSLLYQEVP